MDFTPTEQALIDSAGDNIDVAIYLIKRDRAIDALQALVDLDAMADAIKAALEREDDDNDDDDNDDDERRRLRLDELISYLLQD